MKLLSLILLPFIVGFNMQPNCTGPPSDFSTLLGKCSEINGTKFKVDPYIEAAIHLQRQGEEKAKEMMLVAANSREFEEQVIVLCRMMFIKKSDGEFRRPLIGAAGFLGGTDYDDWTDEPIELVDGIPFLITQGYSLGGQPEPATRYFKYCLENCDWTTHIYQIPDNTEKQMALKKLVSSTKWTRDLTPYELEFLSAQI